MNLIGRPRAYHPDRPATSAERQRIFAQKRQVEVQRLRQQLRQKVYHGQQAPDLGDALARV